MRQPVPFGKYLLLDRISVGGMAEVFKAKSYGVEGFEKIIAIKRILPTMGEDRDFIKMFIDEAKIAGQLAHANICQIFELGRIDGSHFIAMEYIWGKDLLQIQNRLRKVKQAMPVAMACFSIAKVLEGLDYAHRKRDPLGRPLEIVHRDCSPQNVLVSYEGEVKVIDFGIAKATSRNSRTMAGVLKGKFGYMSPEQVRGLPLDRRSDIFALGTMLYECLTGDRLFQGETDFSTLEKVRNVDIRPPREINPNIPEAVEKVILKALAKDVEDRYQWCSEMLADLQQYLMSQDVVFTAKSLSGWLKEIFAGEIEKERQQLEQYKRVGRDGLIAGVPAAAAKMDVVENLGEAGAPEGDATQLGGPNFEDLDSAHVGASPQLGDIGGSVGPALGSPAARGTARPSTNNDNDGDFGEEAPTEIFGEIGGDPVAAVAAVAAARANVPAAGRPAAGTPAPQKPVQKPGPAAGPPPRAATIPPPAPASPPMAYAAAGVGGGGAPSRPSPVAAAGEGTMNVTDSDIVPANQQAARDAYAQSFPHLAQPSPQQGFSAQPQGQAPQGYGAQPGYPANPYGQPSGPHGGQLPTGTPQAMPQQPMNALAPPGQGPAGRTMIGVQAPPGLPNYSGGTYPPMNQSVSGPQPAQNPYGQYQPPHMHGGYPQQQPNPYGSGPMNQVPGVQGGYGQPGYPPNPAAAVDPQMQPAPEGRKRASIGRDVAIGVAIAAIVLGGFLAVKFLVLDAGDSKPAETAQTSSIATIKLSLPAGVSADLFVDDKKIATVSNGQEIPVTAGQRKVKLIGPNNARCEQELKLPAGKTTPLECVMYVAAPATKPPAPPAGPGSGSGSATGTTAGSGSGAGSAATTTTQAVTTQTQGSGATKPVDKTVETTEIKKPVDKTTTTTTKPVDKTMTATTTKPVDKTTTKPVDKTTTRPEDKTTTTKPDKGPVADASKGYLQVYSKPSAKISIDGVDSGLSTPIAGRALQLTPGKHKVTFTIGGDKFTFAVMIKAGATETLSKDLQ